MSVRIQIARSVRGRVPSAVVRRVQRSLERAGARLLLGRDTRSALGVRIVNDDEIAILRLRHLGQSGPTDVLSFPADPGPDEGPFASDDDLAGVGDLVISWDAVLRQSIPRGTGPAAWAAEASDLLIHGLVHLLGHDHANRSQGRAMLRLEARGARAASVSLGERPYGHRR